MRPRLVQLGTAQAALRHVELDGFPARGSPRSPSALVTFARPVPAIADGVVDAYSEEQRKSECQGETTLLTCGLQTVTRLAEAGGARRPDP